MDMTEVRGRSVSDGVAIGPAFVPVASVPRVVGTPSARTPEEELLRLDGAVDRAQAQLDSLRERTSLVAGASAAEILDVQRLMLDDPDYREMIELFVREQGFSAAGAVLRACGHFARTFAESGDACLAARAGDVRDVSNRLVACLDGRETEDVPTCRTRTNSLRFTGKSWNGSARAGRSSSARSISGRTRRPRRCRAPLRRIPRLAAAASASRLRTLTYSRRS